MNICKSDDYLKGWETMEIRDLRFFCLTAEMEHVSKAAEKLGIAQPYLTKIIGQIEEEIGTQLFDKVGRQIRLNHYGEVFYLQSKKVLAAVENLYTEMDYVMEKQSRTITLMSNTQAYTSGMIVEFQKKNAGYGLKVIYGTYKEMRRAVVTGEVDFALCDPPIDGDEVTKTDIVFFDTAYALLPPGHPYLSRSSLTFEDLKDERLITSAKGGAMRWHVDSVYERRNVHPHIVCETHDLNLIIQAVESGLGFAYISYSVLYSHPEIRNRCVAIDSPDRFGKIALSYNRLAMDNRNCDDFRNFTVQYFSELQKVIDKTFDDEYKKL